MQAVPKAQINNTARNDARGIAQMIRVGLCRLVHVKTLRSQKLRMLLMILRRTGPNFCGTSRQFQQVSIVGARRFKVLKAPEEFNAAFLRELAPRESYNGTHSPSKRQGYTKR